MHEYDWFLLAISFGTTMQNGNKKETEFKRICCVVQKYPGLDNGTGKTIQCFVTEKLDGLSV